MQTQEGDEIINQLPRKQRRYLVHDGKLLFMTCNSGMASKHREYILDKKKGLKQILNEY